MRKFLENVVIFVICCCIGAVSVKGVKNLADALKYKKNTVAQTKVTYAKGEVITKIFNFFDKTFYSNDANYHVPSEEIWEEIREAWKARPKHRPYQLEGNDCDDFAERYQRFAKDYAYDKYGINLPVFFFGYWFMDGKNLAGHAINLEVVKCENGVLVPQFIEPQTGEVVFLDFSNILKITIK